MQTPSLVRTLQDFRDAIGRVHSELGRYRGEKIVAHEHPLHAAVVKLETLCCKRDPQGRTQQIYHLIRPANRVWYALLNTSRGVPPTKVPTQENQFLSLLPKEKRRRAKILAGILDICLLSMEQAIVTYVAAGGKLPFAKRAASGKSS